MRLSSNGLEKTARTAEDAGFVITSIDAGPFALARLFADTNQQQTEAVVPVPFILLLIRRIFDWLRGTRLFGPRIDWLERRAHLKGRMVRKYRLPGLIILVAIPLPGTGAWTGALVAALLDIRMRHALPAIFLGVVIAGAIVTTLTYGVVQLF